MFSCVVGLPVNVSCSFLDSRDLEFFHFQQKSAKMDNPKPLK